MSSISSIKRSRGVRSGEEGVIFDAYVHATKHRNSKYRKMVKKSLCNTRFTKHPHLKILWSTTTPRDPHFLAPLHGILPWHGPTVYVHISNVNISDMISIAANTDTASRLYLATHHLSDANTGIVIGSSALVTVSDLIRLVVLIWVDSQFLTGLDSVFLLGSTHV